ncbi:hypothetical protein BT96DRAFT_844312 [Gymnopus androsaceus JB14]|uniref:Uncharacterized protein n=1 Tax=Gymnopus androsaceus JB14 TaxID=1447944 RepID=A0A6A4GCV8_9AGAR|nr:hypothetical protein BT96DRAFT_844312 [Gymnopus androsaceus JB14]
MSWWCFPFEHLIGALQRINTNEHIGGASCKMEATIIKSVTCTANMRHWLHRPDCPEAVWQLKIMFNKCFVPANAVKPENGLRPMKGPRRAYARWDAANFSAAKTHPGNATIIYQPTPCEKPIAGQIQDIRNITTPSGFTVELHIRPFEHLPKLLYDPFSHYPHLSATSYSSTLREKKDIIRLEDIVAHAARFDYSYHRTVLVNLSRD